MLPKLNLPDFKIQTRIHEGKYQIYDVIRRKYVALTPEEWVRQHFVHFLINDRGIPSSLIAVEKSLKYNQLSRRYDIVVHDRMFRPLMLIECKASDVPLKQEVFEQAARYNMAMKVKLLCITNGINHYCCHVKYEEPEIVFLKDVPMFEEMIKY